MEGVSRQPHTGSGAEPDKHGKGADNRRGEHGDSTDGGHIHGNNRHIREAAGEPFADGSKEDRRRSGTHGKPHDIVADRHVHDDSVYADRSDVPRDNSVERAFERNGCRHHRSGIGGFFCGVC